MAIGSDPSAAKRPWMRACAVAMAVLAIAVLLSGTLSWWRLLFAALLLACPVLTIWLGWKYARPGARLEQAESIKSKEIRQ